MKTQPSPHADSQRRIALEARDWIVRLSSGAAGAEDLARFRAWRDAAPAHARAFARERAFWQDLGGLDAVLERAPDGATDTGPARRLLDRRGVLLGGGALAAASVAGAVMVPKWLLWQQADAITGIGEMVEFDLPDGSRAALNTDSAIALDFTAEARQVTLLRGEAEFWVRPAAQPFRVAALGGSAQALGTVFSVRLAGDLATVAVARGAVRVSDGAAAVDLGAAQQTSYGPEAPPLAPVAIDRDIAFAWRGGRIIFEGKPLGQALDELGRYLPERIVMAPGVDAAVPVSAVFSTAEALPAVQALARTQGRSARRIPGVMILIA